MNVFGPTALTGSLQVSTLQSGSASMIVADKNGILGVAPVPIGDQMGSQIATRNLLMNGYFITNDDSNPLDKCTDGIFIAPNGNVCIKTNISRTNDDFTVAAPETKSGTYMRVTGTNAKPAIMWATSGSKSIGMGVADNIGYLYETTDALDKKIMTFRDGVVGIGVPDGVTMPVGHLLYVTGGITAEEVKVKLKANWSDYVFEKGYNLLPLNEVENFINQNKHLPEVPNQVEVQQNGIDLGAMNALLLKKIEELTLYMIEQDKRIKVLEGK
jgi:hypothetical protein